MKLNKTSWIPIASLLAGLVVMACSQSEMVPIGPDVRADLVIYFKAGVSAEQINQFWNQVLSNPHSSGRGTWPKDGISQLSAVFPAVQGHEGVAVIFWRTATEGQRQRLKADVSSSPLVFKVLENVAPRDVKTLD
jgi:hypothetical protein